MAPEHPVSFSTIWALAGLLVFASLIRLLLIFGGGELLHQDGPEYFGFSQILYKNLMNQNWREAFTIPVFAHWGCIFFGTIPFFLKPAWLTQPETSALFFALPAVINIYLLFRIVELFGGKQRVALLSACLYTISFSTLYHTRHVHPHDLSLMFFLLGVLLTLKKFRDPLRIPLIGLCQFLCFFTYYGYWMLAFSGMLFVSLHRSSGISKFLYNGILATTGCITPLLLFFAIGHHYNASYLSHFIHFSQTINMGDFNQGHLIPIVFLWHTEGLLFVLWMVCLLLAYKCAHQYAVKCCLIGLSLIYTLFVISSNLFEQFVVYGRLVKVMVPMLCLLSAHLLTRIRLPRLALILLWASLLPGFLFQAWQVHKVSLWPDLLKRERVLRAELPDRQVRISGACQPHHPACGETLGTKCSVIEQFPAPENLPFYQYDSVTLAERQLSKQFTYYLQIVSCPPDR